MYPGHHAQTSPDKAAAISAPTGEVLTYAELDARSNRLAQLLWSQGPACALPIPGDLIPGPAVVPGKEYSDHSDQNAVPALDPEQNIAWTGVVPGGVADTTECSGSRVVPGDAADREVDALANSDDALFDAVIVNDAALLWSVDTSPDIYVEDTASVIAPGPWAWAVGSPPFPPGNDIDQHGVADLDGLEVWGAEGRKVELNDGG